MVKLAMTSSKASEEMMLSTVRPAATNCEAVLVMTNSAVVTTTTSFTATVVMTPLTATAVMTSSSVG